VLLCGLTLKMETIRSSETLITTFKAIGRHSSKDHNPCFHCRQNLKSHTKKSQSTYFFLDYGTYFFLEKFRNQLP
jgi:cytidine deaminase